MAKSASRFWVVIALCGLWFQSLNANEMGQDKCNLPLKGMNMKSRAVVATLLALSFSPAFAGEAPAILSIINKKINELKTLQVGDYRLAWGRPSSVIDSVIAEAAATNTTTSSLSAAIKSAVDSTKNTRGATQSCVITLVITNNGAYTSSRECTTDYVDRSYMDTYIYPAMSAYLVGRLPNIDFAQDSYGLGYAGFYTSAGKLSEFIVFSNATQ
jgi:hypothetical protein